MSDVDSPGVATRRAALRLLDAVLRRGIPLEAALAGATEGLERGDDRALAHALAAAVLRWLPDLDVLIDGATPNPLPGDAKARFVLRLALAQALILKTPAHAAISTVLPLIDGGPKRLVHGVFGTVMREGAALPEAPGLPAPVAKRWRKAWGAEMVVSARSALATQPPIDLTLADTSQTNHWVEVLNGESLAPGHVRIAASSRVADLPGYAEGAWWVQNIAASIPARLLGAGAGRRVLDLCAAPGGKTLQLAAAGWQVSAVDISEIRLVRMTDNLERTQLKADLTCADLLEWEPEDRYDAILLDAPCSATGIFARHPDVLHRIRAKDITAMAELQKTLLARALGWLNPAGRLIYATCSLEREEGEGVLHAALSCGAARIDPIAAQEIPFDFQPDAQGRLRVLPQLRADGFFIARMMQS